MIQLLQFLTFKQGGGIVEEAALEFAERHYNR